MGGCDKTTPVAMRHQHEPPAIHAGRPDAFRALARPGTGQRFDVNTRENALATSATVRPSFRTASPARLDIATMGTVLTMTSAAEAASRARCGIDSRRDRGTQNGYGHRGDDMVWSDLKPRDFIAAAASTTDHDGAGVGGSTNWTHRRRAGVPLTSTDSMRWRAHRQHPAARDLWRITGGLQKRCW
jgi:hypothetical protein